MGRPVLSLPDAVSAVCGAHAVLVDEPAPGLLDGLSPHGSICFDGELFASSDVDFVATLTRRPGECDVDALRHVHAEIANAGAWPVYDGFYLLESDLAGPPEAVPAPPVCLTAGSRSVAGATRSWPPGTSWPSRGSPCVAETFAT